MSIFRLSNIVRPTLSELLFPCHLRTVTTCRIKLSKYSISPAPGFFLESGNIDSDSEDISPPKVKNRDENVITVPVRLKKRLEKRLVKENTAYFQRQKIINASRLGNKARIVVHCKRHELNHYYGQSYAKGSEIPLASTGWSHRKSVGDFMTIKPQTEGLSPFGLNGENSNFEDLGLSAEIAKVIQDNSILQPTHIQTFAIPQLLKGENSLIAAETGCGKTFAYLLPLFQQILTKKTRENTRKVNQPYAVIVLPSRELADQIYNVASLFAKQLNINVRLLQGGSVSAKIKDPSTSVVDLLISTASVAAALTSVGVFDPKEVEHIVLDEADSLLDDSFSDIVKQFLRNFNFFHDTENPVQISLVSATLPRSVDSILADVVPVDSLVRITTPNLHRVLAHVPQTFLRLKKIQKPEKILEIVKKDDKLNIPVMIFCNKSSTCAWMNHYLQSNGFNSVALHGKKDTKYRKGLMEDYQSGKSSIMASTDLGSRGLDTLRTGHVVNYDFPNFLSDYIHRCGRTGRVGSALKGRVTNFISKPHEVLLVQEIEKSVRTEVSLEQVNANIKRILNSRYGMYQPILPPDKDEESKAA